MLNVFKSKLPIYDDYHLAISLFILLVKHIDFNVYGCYSRSGIIKFNKGDYYFSNKKQLIDINFAT